MTDFTRLDIHVGNIYRYYQGTYAFVLGLVNEFTSLGTYVRFVKIGSIGEFTVPLDFFLGDKICIDHKWVKVIDSPLNTTGQTQVFELVHNLNFQLSSVSTVALVKELQKRSNNPYAPFDLEGLNNQVVGTDYVVGLKHIGKPGYKDGVDPINVFFTVEEAQDYARRIHNPNKGVFKRTFIQVPERE